MTHDELRARVGADIKTAIQWCAVNIQCFDYQSFGNKPPLVVRDISRPPGKQVVWSGENYDAQREAVQTIIRNKLADAALAAVREALREPSAEMRVAGLNSPMPMKVGDPPLWLSIYRAMLAASPLAEPQA